MRLVAEMILVGMMALIAGVACGQNYPSRPIRIVTTTVGSGSDFTSRLVAQEISGPLGQPVIVDNRNGTIPSIEVVIKAPPDGYTLLASGSVFWITPLLQKTFFDPEKDFSSVILTDKSPNILAVHPSLSVTSVKELIALAKAKPGELNYASGQTGSSGHLAGELFKAMAGVNIVRVPYKGSALATNALLGGEVQMLFTNDVSLMNHAKSGRLRALAVTSVQPSVLAPGLPTVASSGLPGYESVSITGIFAPVKTPGTIINRLNQEMARFLRTSNAKEKFLAVGQEAVGSTPEELAAAVRSDIVRMGKVIRDAGIKTD